MQAKRKTMIVTGAARGIGAGITNALLERGYNVVGNSLNITASAFPPTAQLAVVRGDIGNRSEERRVGKERRSRGWSGDWSSDVCSSDLLERGYNVVGNSLNITASAFPPTAQLAVVRGDIGN